MCYILKTYQKRKGLTDITLSESVIPLEIYKTELSFNENSVNFTHEIKEYKPSDMPSDFVYIQSRLVVIQDVQVGKDHRPQMEVGLVHDFSKREE